MTIRLHRGDLPDISRYSGAVAIDTETMGLDLNRDRLCVVQLSPGDGSADVVQIAPHAAAIAPNLKRLLTDTKLLKIFHFARFDLGMLCKTFGVMPEPVFCTKIASPPDPHLYRPARPQGPGARSARSELSKQQQSSDWGAAALSDAQVSYAASDVAHLHALKEKLVRHAGARGPRRARARPVSVSCRCGCGSTLRALPQTTYLPIHRGRRRRG